MSPRTNEQYEKIRKEKRQLIMDAGLKLFSEKGYSNTSISQIASRVKISKGLIYNYFVSKDDLLLTIMQDGIDSLMNLYDRNKDGVLESNEMEYFIRESFRLIEENTDYWRLYFQVIMQSGVMEMLEESMAKVYEQILGTSMRYFSRMGFENPAAEAIRFGAMMDGLSLQYVASPDKFPFEMIRDAVIQKYCTPQKK